jgi:hypothetical protein
MAVVRPFKHSDEAMKEKGRGASARFPKQARGLGKKRRARKLKE